MQRDIARLEAERAQLRNRQLELVVAEVMVGLWEIEAELAFEAEELFDEGYESE